MKVTKNQAEFTEHIGHSTLWDGGKNCWVVLISIGCEKLRFPQSPKSHIHLGYIYYRGYLCWLYSYYT